MLNCTLPTLPAGVWPVTLTTLSYGMARAAEGNTSPALTFR